MSRTLWGLIVFFFLEIAGFIVVGRLIGVFFTLLLIILTSALGVWLVREQGIKAACESARWMQGARILDPERLPNPLKLFAGFLLILPGFMTDLMGLTLLLPGVQHRFERKFLRRGNIYDARRFGDAINDAETPNPGIKKF